MTTIDRKRGDTFPIELTIYVSDEVAALPLDITGATGLLLTVDPSRSPEDDSNNLFQLEGNILDAPAGSLQFPVADADADFVGKFFYDVQITLDGYRMTVASGRYILRQDITKN